MNGAVRGYWTLAAAYVIGTLLFGWLPDTFFNYGYNYYQFLPAAWLLVPLALLGLLYAGLRYGPIPVPRAVRLAAIGSLPMLVVVLGWGLRTQIHVFGGDGAVGTVVQGGFSLTDWIPPWPLQGRLDGYGSTFVAKCCRELGLFHRSPVLTSILSTQVYAVLMGAIFTVLTLVGFRRRAEVVPILLTLPFMFNFFGNVDNYAFSLVMGLVILIAVAKVQAEEKSGWVRLVALGTLWGFGLWTHPFHVFWGFPLAAALGRQLSGRPWFRWPPWSLSVAFGAVLLVAIKLSSNGNHWFLWEPAKVPPTFSLDTLTHYLNMILLPGLPFLGGLWLERRREPAVRAAMAMFLAASACFFALAFTLGAVDQLNYQHLLFFMLAPLVLAVVKTGLSRAAVLTVVACNLALLVPMIGVHSTARTIRRAEAVYPLDPCQHNREMSWQTHLGLCLADNLQEDPEIRRAVLRTFAHGARQAQPEGFRGGNLLYHTAFLYHYGDFEAGRAQLYSLLGSNGQLVNWLLGERPGFIFCNRQRLWADLDEFIARRHPELLEQYRSRVRQLSEQCRANPYYLKRPRYAVTEF